MKLNNREYCHYLKLPRHTKEYIIVYAPEEIKESNFTDHRRDRIYLRSTYAFIISIIDKKGNKINLESLVYQK